MLSICPLNASVKGYGHGGQEQLSSSTSAEHPKHVINACYGAVQHVWTNLNPGSYLLGL